jgi:hypothetical protein
MVLCSAYSTHDEASRAVRALLAAGVPGDGIRVLMGEPERDARTESKGAFAGSAGTAGSFAGVAPTGAGSFAGDALMQRGGSFADADREIVTTYADGVAHMRVAGHRSVRRLLRDAGLDEATVERDAESLHRGRILVLVDAGDRAAADVRAALALPADAARSAR